MRTYEEFTDNVLSEVKRKKKRRNIKRTIISLSTASVLVFLVLFSNIINFNFLTYNNSYKKYLASYVSRENGYSSLKILDGKNAALTIDDNTYLCGLKNKSPSKFSLTAYGNDEEEGEEDAHKTVFSVKFSGDTAVVEGETEDGIVKKVLTVAEDIEIECGVWSLFGIRSPGGEMDCSISGGGWILLLENGAYMGEGIDSAYSGYFLGVGDRLLQYYKDSLGNLVGAATFNYIDDGSFDFPVIEQRYLEDGDPYKFYFKLLNENELFDFNGGEFTAKGATTESENYMVEKEGIFEVSEVKWRLLPKKSQKFHKIDANFNISLEPDGSVNFKISGNRSYNTKSGGRWYRLKDSVLVILNKGNGLTGKIFTMFGGSDYSEYPGGGNSFEESALTTVYSYTYYKVGYHWFYYYCLDTSTKIYWGSNWDADYLEPELIYDVPYVLNGKYFEEYYSGRVDYMSTPEGERMKDFPENGEISLIFRENGKMEEYRGGVLKKTRNYWMSNDHGITSLVFSGDMIIHLCSRGPIKANLFSIGAGNLYYNSNLHCYEDGQHFTIRGYDIVFRVDPNA